MLTYILIVLCLSLAGVAGLQLTYMAYLDRMDKERRRRLHDLESDCRELRRRLADADARIKEKDRIINAMYAANGEEEVWAEILDDR